MGFKGMFVNLPVKDLGMTMEFFGKLGFEFNPYFTDENATCMVIGENMYAMLLVEEYFKTFSQKEIVDNTEVSEVLTALAVDCKEMVDDIARKVKDAGGILDYEPKNNGRCTELVFMILTGISGNYFTWMKVRFRNNFPFLIKNT